MLPKSVSQPLTGSEAIEAKAGSKLYFPTPYHSWERGTSENTNGVVRQYLAKRREHGSRRRNGDWGRFAQTLNNRARKRLGFRTPKDFATENISTI